MQVWYFEAQNGIDVNCARIVSENNYFDFLNQQTYHLTSLALSKY